MERFVEFLSNYLYSNHLPSRIGSWGILVLLTATFLFMLKIITSRMKNSRDERVYHPVIERMQALLTDFVFDEEKYKPDTEHYRELVTTLHYDARKKYTRKKLVEIILSLNNAFKGEASERLQGLYVDLRIKADAVSLLKHGEWYEKAFIIKELAQMNARDVLPLIMKYINHYSRVLREESQFAAVTLGGIENLDFLMKIRDPLSEWQQTRILLELDRHFHNQLPSFYYLLKAENPTVVTFALKLISHFRQLGDYEELEAVFKRGDEKVKTTAVETFCKLELNEAEDFLIRQFFSQTKKVQLKIIETLGTIGSRQSGDFLAQFLQHEDYSYVLGASRTLIKLGFNATTSQLRLPEVNSEIYKHAVNEAMA